MGGRPADTIAARSPDEDDLIERTRARDRVAFEQLYRLHVRRIYALCLRMAGETNAAEEFTQDVFVRVWESISSYRAESAFSTWLHRVAVNVVLASRRAGVRRLKRIFFADDIEEHDSPSFPPGETMDLENAIASLPPQARKVLVLHDVEGYRHAEIASMMGLAVGTSKTQLHRARKLLRGVLQR